MKYAEGLERHKDTKVKMSCMQECGRMGGGCGKGRVEVRRGGRQQISMQRMETGVTREQSQIVKNRMWKYVNRLM